MSSSHTPLSVSLSSFSLSTPPPTSISTLSLHDALPISGLVHPGLAASLRRGGGGDRRVVAGRGETERHRKHGAGADPVVHRSEEHTSELQSPCNLVCRLLLEKKKNTTDHMQTQM